MKQNIYDNPAMFNAYMEFRRGDVGHNAALEIPAMLSLLPDVCGKRVCDIGCGAGKLSRYIAANGAKSVVGIDPSARMLAIAEAENKGFEGIIKYHREFIEEFSVPPCSFDLVVSSLALHYVAEIEPLFGKVRGWLRPGGILLFSIEHPVFSGGPREWVRGPAGEKYWPVADYFSEGGRSISWLAADVVKYHRTVSTWANALIESGFNIARVMEPRLAVGELADSKDTRCENARPSFLIFFATVPLSPACCTEGNGTVAVVSKS